MLVSKCIITEVDLKSFSSKVYYCQHQKRASVLVDFHNKLIQCKLLDYILSILLIVVIWNGNC